VIEVCVVSGGQIIHPSATTAGQFRVKKVYLFYVLLTITITIEILTAVMFVICTIISSQKIIVILSSHLNIFILILLEKTFVHESKDSIMIRLQRKEPASQQSRLEVMNIVLN
jgi:hypothetical protein